LHLPKEGAHNGIIRKVEWFWRLHFRHGDEVLNQRVWLVVAGREQESFFREKGAKAMCRDGRARATYGPGSRRPQGSCHPIINRPLSIINRRAFTLIELLVVIGIIALLLAILLPITQRVRNHARAVACQAHLGQWGVITAIYVNENNGKLPRISPWDVLMLEPWEPADNYHPKAAYLVPGLDINYYDNDFVLCPVARRWQLDPQSLSSVFLERSGWTFVPGSKLTAWCHLYSGRRPSAPPTEISGSYGFNEHLSEFSPDRYPRLPRSNVPYLLDSAGWRVRVRWHDEMWPPLEPPAYDDEPPYGLPWPDTTHGMKAFCLDRHSGAVNSLFLDWSVRRVGLKELWTLKWHEKFDTANKWTKAGGVEPEDWPQWMWRFKDY
jgi:prepilin-type N-terminal cleavage/methylation domain-containing protein/prepilin-type processing-associated H-X9-DG protein